MKTLLATLALAGTLATAASAQSALYGVTFVTDQLISIDTATGTGTVIGSLGAAAPFGLASFGGSFFTFDSSASRVDRINVADGSTLTAYNVGLGPVLGQGGLAFQSNTVGYLTSALDPTTLGPANDLYRFDIAAGTSSLVAHTTPTLESLAFSANGTLYGLGKLDGNLYTVNPTTGQTTLVGNTGVGVGSPIGALTFGSGGKLFASLDDNLYTLDPANGAATEVNPAIDGTGFNAGFGSVSGLAPVAVPESGSFALLAAGLLPIGLLALRRRKA